MSHEHKILLLVGRTGNGKSSTGNSILGEDKFISHGAGEDDSGDVPVKHVNGSITVVDGSGIGDPGEDVMGGENGAITACDMAFELCGKTFNVILFVLKYGVRFTKQEKEGVQMVKFLFGDDVLKRWGIIVMTYGDNFERGNTESFQFWCKEQKGDFKFLYEECKERCVLFDNSTKDPNKKKYQLDQLWSFITKNEAIPPYTEDDFKIAVKNRGKIDPIHFPKEQNNSSTKDLLDNSKIFLEDTLVKCRQFSVELERAKGQEKDPEVVYQINVLLEQFRKTDGVMAAMWASVKLVYFRLHQWCMRLIERREVRVGPDQLDSDSWSCLHSGDVIVQ